MHFYFLACISDLDKVGRCHKVGIVSSPLQKAEVQLGTKSNPAFSLVSSCGVIFSFQPEAYDLPYL